jgi:chromosome segregation ATPase
MTENNKPENFRRLVSMTGGNPYDKVFQSDKLREEVIKEWNQQKPKTIVNLVDLAITKAREDEWNKVTDYISYKKMKEKDNQIAKLKAENKKLKEDRNGLRKSLGHLQRRLNYIKSNATKFEKANSMRKEQLKRVSIWVDELKSTGRVTAEELKEVFLTKEEYEIRKCVVEADKNKGKGKDFKL